jgi:hypothetical protein
MDSFHVTRRLAAASLALLAGGLLAAAIGWAAVGQGQFQEHHRMEDGIPVTFPKDVASGWGLLALAAATTWMSAELALTASRVVRGGWSVRLPWLAMALGAQTTAFAFLDIYSGTHRYQPTGVMAEGVVEAAAAAAALAAGAWWLVGRRRTIARRAPGACAAASAALLAAGGIVFASWSSHQEWLPETVFLPLGLALSALGLVVGVSAAGTPTRFWAPGLAVAALALVAQGAVAIVKLVEGEPGHLIAWTQPLHQAGRIVVAVAALLALSIMITALVRSTRAAEAARSS